MAKLYPPNIQGVIPAFYGTTLVVPFSMNKAVGESEISGFEVKIKTISGIVKATVKSTEIDFNSYEVTFDLSEKKNSFNIGQFYKIQIAYIDKKSGTIGYYSTVGMSKYTAIPEVYIEGLNKSEMNTHIYNYVGVYSQLSNKSEVDRDASEKLYSSRFIVFDEDKNVYKDSGEIIHNTTKDVSTYEASESFSLTEDLEDEKIFYIQYSIRTVNLLQVKSPLYRFKQRRSINAEQKVYIQAENDFVNGCINLSISSDKDKITGSFIISKSNSKNNFLDWEESFRIDLPYAIKPSEWAAKDFTCEQGVYYKYAIQQYNNNGVYSEKNISEKVFSDFEDSFLYDGEKLLNIRFNPKVSSFKIDLQENKQDTIGSQFPYFFRNAHVNYKEFPISGLISYLSDVDKMFMSEDRYIVDVETTNLISENVSTEREFKLEVLSWLTNGKPKMFKSPAEGNYIVRLMNSSLAPTDSLSRMLHTFSTTAYEIMEFNGENLRECGFVGNASIPIAVKSVRTTQIRDLISEVAADENGFYTIPTSGLNSISFTGLDPGTLVEINDNQFMIGGTGSLYFEGDDGSINSIAIKPNNPQSLNGNVSYTYNQDQDGYFEIVTSIQNKEVPLIQFFGNFYAEEQLVNSDGEINETGSNNIYDFITDVRTEISKMYMIRFEKRIAEEFYVDPSDTDTLDYLETLLNNRSYSENMNIGDFILNNDKNENVVTLYKEKECINQVNKYVGTFENLLSVNKIYFIRKGYSEDLKNENRENYQGYYIDANEEELCPYLGIAIDGLSYKYFRTDDTMYMINIDGEEINIKEKLSYNIPYPDDVRYIDIGHGVTAELSYSKTTLNYSIEETNKKLKTLKNNYLTLLNFALLLDSDHKYYLTMGAKNDFILSHTDRTQGNKGKIESSEILRNAYYEYISELTKQLNEYKEKNQLL